MIISRNNIGFLLLIIFVVSFSLAPFVFIFYSAGEHWQGIIPAGYVGDSEFYMVRMVKGTHLFPFGNNPFFIEDKQDFNPALSIADYLAE